MTTFFRHEFRIFNCSFKIVEEILPLLAFSTVLFIFLWCRFVLTCWVGLSDVWYAGLRFLPRALLPDDRSCMNIRQIKIKNFD